MRKKQRGLELSLSIIKAIRFDLRYAQIRFRAEIAGKL
jgi:hypothetical protein